MNDGKGMSQQEQNKKLIQEGFDRWASNQGSFFDLLSDGVEWTITGSNFEGFYGESLSAHDFLANKCASTWPSQTILARGIALSMYLTRMYALGERIKKNFFYS